MSTNGTITRHTISLTKNADNTSQVKITAGNRCVGFRRRRTTSAFHSKKPTDADCPENTRIGLDSFAANLFGKVDHIEIVGPNRWIRQGQKFATIKAGGDTVDLLSPVEGVVTAINHDVVQEPVLLTKDPFKDGWVAIVKSPDFAFNQKNLVQGSMVAPWMQNNECGSS